MFIRTGQTVYEQIISLDVDNNPLTAVTFETVIYKDGDLDPSISIDLNISDYDRAVFTASWSASTFGDYQLYAKNNETSVIFISNTVFVRSDSEISPTIYIGL